MLRAFLMTAAVAVSAVFSVPAQSQVQVEFGFGSPGYDGPRYHEQRAMALPNAAVIASGGSFWKIMTTVEL